MVELKQIGIKRKVYRLELRKRFVHTRSYRIKERKSIDVLRQSVQKFISRKSGDRYRPSASTPPPNAGFNPVILGVALFLALLVLGGAYVYFTFQAAPASAAPSTLPERPALLNEIVRSGIVTAGDRTANEYVGYVQLESSAHGLSNYTVSITPYDEKLPGEIFVLTTGTGSVEGYPEFLAALRRELGNKQRTISELDIRRLEDAPEGAIVVVPSGNIPKELLGVNSRADINQLLDRGFVVIYIGLPFTSMLDNDLIVPTPPATLQRLGLQFEEGTSFQSEPGFSLYQPLYRVGGAQARMAYGSVSMIGGRNGSLIVLPQTLNGGWKGNMTTAARDVSRIVFETPWAEPLAEPKIYTVGPSGSFEGSSIRQLFSMPIPKNHASLKIQWSASDRSDADGRIVQEDWQIVRAEKESRGELYVAGSYVVTPTYISGSTTRLNAKLNEPEPGERFLFISITNATHEVGERISKGERNLVGEIPDLDIPVELDSGEYIASLIDEESRLYAQTYLQVASVDIYYMGQTGRGIYRFEIDKGNQPEKLDTEVVVDDGRYGTYRFQHTSDVVVNLLGATGGEELPYGEHVFTFRLGHVQKSVLVKLEPPRTIFSNPFVIGSVLFAGIILAVGLYFSRKEDVLYRLDIPDFPPVARTKIPLRSETILGLFGKINQDYKWESTPLSLSEIKNGFKTILYQGRPIFVSDYNMEYLLDQLTGKGLLGSFLDYYAPLVWEKKTQQTVHYLCFFRKLRDILVTNAIPFTGRGEEEGCDTKITIVGQEMFVHLFNGFGGDVAARLVAGTLGTVPKGISIVLFVDDEQKREFSSLLASNSPALLLLKVEVEGSSVLLLTIPEFEKMVKELKGF